MRSRTSFLALTAAAIVVTAMSSPWVAQALAAEARPLVREIFVPFDDLEALLESQPQRVLLSREQYEDLLKKAKKVPEIHAPQPALVAAADYVAAIQDERAQITGTLSIDVLEDGLHALALDLSGVGLRRAVLDDRGAPVGRSGDGKLTLFVEGKGRHTLTLEMVAPVQTTAAQQVLSFRLPRPPAARLRLTVPGDVEVKSGASVASRVVDEAAGVTRFELLPAAGDTTLVMTLNSRLARRQRAVVARSVLVDEVTQAYERLHATVSLAILHQAVDRFRFVVPEGFEVTEVTAPLVARWAIEAEGQRRVLDVRLREQTLQTVVLNIAAVRTPPPLEKWTLPKLEPLEVVGQVAVVGLLAEDRLSAESIAAQGMIPIDTAVIQTAIPASLLRAEPGAPLLKPVVAYYAPHGEFGLSGRFVKPPAELTAITNVLLSLGDRGQDVRGGFLLVPKAERLFGFDFSVPAGWHVSSLTGADNKPLLFERFGEPGKPGRIRVRLPQGAAPAAECRVYFQATATPVGWLGAWESSQVAFPKFVVAGTTRDRGAIAVDVRDDLIVRPDKLQALTPLDEAEKERYGLGGVSTRLAFRYETPDYEASVAVERTRPRVTARSISFFRVESDAVAVHAEVIYQVEEARARQLSLSLPEDTPAAISIRGLDDVKVKESVSETAGARRRWNVLLEEPRRGTVRLAIDFQQPVPEGKIKDFALPVVRAEAVEYQSGLVAAEGSAELDVQVSPDAAMRRVDVGELVDAAYQPGRRLLGVWGFVGDPPPAKVNAARQSGYGLYPAIVQQAELGTVISPDGVAQTEAVFQLHTKAVYLEVVLPKGDQSELWSMLVDDKPVKAQSQAGRLLVSLPAAPANQVRKLKIVYETPILTVPLVGKVELDAPKLLFRGEQDTAAVEVPTADLVWHLYLPSGYQVIRSDGTVVAQIEAPEPAALTAAKAALGLAAWRTERPEFVGFTAARKVARSPGLAVRETAPYYSEDEARYAPPAADREHSVSPTAVNEKLEKEVLLEDRARGQRRVAEEQAKAAAPPPAEAPAPRAPTGPGMMPGMPGAAPVTGAVTAPAAQPATPPPPAAPAAEPPAEQKPKAPPAYKARLEGVSSLKIDLQASTDAGSPRVTFQSLGVAPRLKVTVANQPCFAALGWALALAVALLGVARTNRPVGCKVRLIVWVFVVGTIVPLLPFCAVLALPCNMAVAAASLLVPYYLIAWALKGAAGLVYRIRTRLWRPAVAVPALLIAAALVCTPGAAQQPAPKTGPYVIQVVEPLEPVKVPEDVVIVPYDPDSKTGIQDARQIMVPYAKYVELWNLAYPDKRLETKAPPAPFALASGSYTTTLEGEEFLLVEGHLEIDVFTDQFVAIPLGLEGGVLARAVLDGQPARLSVVQPDAPPPQRQQQQAAPPAQQPAPPGPPAALVTVHASGKGRHRLELAVRLRLDRRGGWRVVEGVLPAAPATALTIGVPQGQTEVRLSQVPDRRSYELDRPGQKIETALAPQGAVGIQWRPKVGEAQVDRTLTAQSDATLDVQEDGLRLVWQTTMEFRRGQRETFRFHVPADYLVEKVEGTNVRGWEIRREEKQQTVDVTLLKAAKDNERITLRLWRAGRVGEGPLAEFDSPQVSVADAALESGLLTVRRSPLLDVRTLGHRGVTRTEVASKPASPGSEAAAPGLADSPLGLRPYEAYQFATMPFALRLAASPVAGRVSAQVESVLKIGAYERSLESRVRLDVRGRPAHHAEIFLPEELKLDHVSAPGDYQWTVTQVDGRALLTVRLAAGRSGEVPVVIRGTLGSHGPIAEMPLPRLEVRGAGQQEGRIAVQADPVFLVKPARLENCESVLREQLGSWLKPEQVAATTLALRYRGPDYRGALQLELKKPQITCDTITNVRVTDRAVEETVLLDFTIEQAGTRQVAFLLPARMRDSRIQVPMLRQKTVEPAGAAPDAPVRVRIELQDEVMNKLRVLVESDRLLAAQGYTAPIPVVESGQVGSQFVTLESAGRDEVAVESAAGLDPLSRQLPQWRSLQAILGGAITQAYLVRTDPQSAELKSATRTRAVLETAGARIGLAETTLVLDTHGAYRAELVYKVDNTIKQTLEVSLPEGATLWTATVAGEPVKPARVPGADDPRRVLIPLVKTAPGDLDYPVVLKYGGRVPAPGPLGSVQFPLVRTRDMEVEQSHVRLYLPPTHRWLDFGGTMRRAESEDDLTAGRLSYETKRAQRLMDTLRQADPFAKVRAAENLKQLGQAVQSQADLYTSANALVQQELTQNTAVLRAAEQEVQKLQQAPDLRAGVDNRIRLNAFFEQQQASRARDVVKDLGRNFDAPVEANAGVAVLTDGKLNAAWLANSQLAPQVQTGEKKEEADKAVKLDLAPRLKKKGAEVADELGVVNPGIVAGQAQTPSQSQAGAEAAAGGERRLGRGEISERQAGRAPDAVERYQQQLSRGRGVVQGERGGGMPAQQIDALGRPMAQPEAAHAIAGMGMGPALDPSKPADLVMSPSQFGMAQTRLGGLGGFAAEGQQGLAQQAALPTGLASLDFEVPKRGTLYLLTTPGGDVEITARAVSVKLLDGLLRAAAVLVAAWIVVLIGRRAARGGFAWLTGRLACAAMIVVGLGLLLSGFLLAGLLLLVLGIAIAVRRAVGKRAAAVASA